jgi:hypothetical protein
MESGFSSVCSVKAIYDVLFPYEEGNGWRN